MGSRSGGSKTGAGGSNARHVVLRKDGSAAVVAPGARRASAVASTQREAQRRATEIVRKAGGGEVVTHGRNGQIRGSNTIAPAPDPCPPKDTRP